MKEGLPSKMSDGLYKVDNNKHGPIKHIDFLPFPLFPRLDGVAAKDIHPWVGGPTQLLVA